MLHRTGYFFKKIYRYCPRRWTLVLKRHHVLYALRNKDLLFEFLTEFESLITFIIKVPAKIKLIESLKK